jgi:hypothetical protein
MSFYVVLNSNSSKQLFPENVLNCYTTQLKEVINLQDKYEVALVELMYPLNWKFDNYASLIIRKNGFEKKYTISFDVMDNVNQILNNLNEFFVEDDIGVFFAYEREIKKISITVDPYIEIEFLDDFQFELGFRASKFQAPPQKHTYFGFESIPFELNNIKSLFIYSDICVKQFVGDSKEHLLRTITVESNRKFGDYINASFKQPHYLPVSKDSFQSILIYICDDTGKLIHFSNGKVLAKLHFRKIINYT